MYPLRAEGTPLKVHFATPGGSVIGAIFADGLECNSDGIGFYLGVRRVALLGPDQLRFDGRSVDRGCLDRQRPFWFESSDRTRGHSGGGEGGGSQGNGWRRVASR